MNNQLTAYTFKPSRNGKGYDIMRRGTYAVAYHERTRVRAEEAVGKLNSGLRLAAAIPATVRPEIVKPKRKRHSSCFIMSDEEIEYWVDRALSLRSERALNIEMSEKYGKSVSSMYRACFRQMPKHYKFFKGVKSNG